MLRRILGGILLAALSLCACQVLIGIEERSVADGGHDASPVFEDAQASCDADTTRCGSACVDTEFSGEHCGRCGHSCLGAVCRFGACVPEVALDIRSSGAVWAYGHELLLRSVDTSDPAASAGTLVAFDTVTSTTRPLGPVGRYLDVEIAGDEAYLLEYGPTQVRRLNLQTGSGAVLYRQSTADPAFREIAISGDDLFWTTREDVRAMRRDGTGYRILKTVTEGSFGAAPPLVVDSSWVYFGIEDEPLVMAVSRDGGGGRVVDTSRTAPDTQLQGAAIAMRWEDRMLWWSYKEVRSLPFDGGAALSIATTAEAPHGGARDDRYVYFADVFKEDGNAARILRYDPATRAVTVVVSAINDLANVAVVGDWLYYAAFGGPVYRVAK